MCTVPPPPPPPTKTDEIYTLRREIIRQNSENGANNPDLCLWALEHPELREACIKNRICVDQAPFRFMYNNYKSISQVGPTCGLVALSMLVKGAMSPDNILNLAKEKGYTNHGEMFSSKCMLKLTEEVLRISETEKSKAYLQSSELYSKEVVELLLSGAALLVPYDADFNHSPCLKKGNTAHWALICGILLVDDPQSNYTNNPHNVYVLARHGKSRYLATWKLQDLSNSNRNLYEFPAKKTDDGFFYIVPEGGVGGPNGLRDQYVIIERI